MAVHPFLIGLDKQEQPEQADILKSSNPMLYSAARRPRNLLGTQGLVLLQDLLGILCRPWDGPIQALQSNAVGAGIVVGGRT